MLFFAKGPNGSSAASSSPRTTPLCCYSSHSHSLQNNLVSFDQGISGSPSSSEHPSPGALRIIIWSSINFSRALHRRSGSSSRDSSSVTIGSPRATSFPVVTAVEAPHEINKLCWPYAIAGRVRGDKAESTCLDKPIYSFEGSSGAYYKHVLEREKPDIFWYFQLSPAE